MSSGAASLIHTTHLKNQAPQARQVERPLRMGETLRFNLKNGSTIQAKLSAIKDTWVKIHADELGDVTLPKDQIASVSRGKGQPLPVEVAFPIGDASSSAQPNQRGQPPRYDTHAQQATLYHSMKQYDQAEREAQRALSEALRNNDGPQAEAMRAVIRQSRKAQAEINEQRQKYEEQIAQQQKADEAQQWEQNKWKTSIDNTPSIRNTSSMASEWNGKFTPIPTVRSRSATTAPSTVQPEPDLNQLAGEALYRYMMHGGDGRAPASSVQFHGDGRPSTTRTFTTEERTAAQQWSRDEQKKAEQRRNEACSRGGRIQNPDGTVTELWGCP